MRQDPQPVSLDVARLAHELRTPLSAISVLAEMMKDERLGPLGNPRYRGYAADIHESVAHANAVLAAFLESAAAQATGGPMAFAELDLAPIVRGIVSALEPVAAKGGVALSTAVGDGLPHVIADSRSVRQILNNLLANALRFTPPGGQVVVALSYVAAGGVTMSVTDTGDGMMPGELERLRAGQLGHLTARRRSGRSGLGLPLVRALAAANGGVLSIESALGAGTRVVVAFPQNRVVPV
jgi:two-component system cell cycle sensor histidine kinase PleC